jgi:hypothetical protein
MRIASSLFIMAVALLPVTSYAFTDDEARVKHAIKEHQAVVQSYAETRNKPMPQIIDYRYGMKLDVATLVRQSPDLKTCKVSPKLMTYEDSKGALNTIQYLVAGECRNKH